MNKKKRKTVFALASFAVSAMLLISACSSSEPSQSGGQMKAVSEAENQSVAYDTASPSAPAQSAAAPAEAPNQAGDRGSTGAAAGAFANPAATARKMIYQATIVLEVENFVKTRTSLNDLVTRYQGYILSSSDQESEQAKEGTVVVRIPQNGFSSFVGELDKLASKIPVRSIQGQDVTEEYVDLSSRLKAYQVVEARLLQFMNDAKKTEDLLKISNDLAKVQEEIERIKGRMRYLDENISFSTITLTIVEKKVTASLNQVADQGTWKKAWLALNKSTLGLLDFFNGLIVVIAALLPILIVLAIIGLPIFFYWRKRVKKEPPTPPSSVD